MKVLELFAGSRSFSKVAEEMGMETFTTDIKDFGSIDYVVDILNFVPMKVPFKPDIIWASPPCQTFSVMQIGRNWNYDNTPKTEQAKLAIKIVKCTLDIIKYFKPKYFFIENPRGKLRKLDVIKGYDRTTVTYCQYGDKRMKPTDIWSNHIADWVDTDAWKPRPMCKNGMPCHEAAPRGSTTGTRASKNAYERSKIPYELCKEILESCL